MSEANAETKLDIRFTYWELDFIVEALHRYQSRLGTCAAEDRLIARLNEKLVRLEEWATDDD